jgi:hypothetical protein
VEVDNPVDSAESSQPEDAPPLPRRHDPSSPSVSTGSPIESQSMPSIVLDDTTQPSVKTEESDTTSLLSTSSKSAGPRGFRLPSLRRRVTDTGAATAATSGATAVGTGSRPRRPSEPASEDDVASVLDRNLELELQGAGKEGWGIGDDARMGLE